MRKKIFRDLFILILIFLAGWAGFTYLKLGPDKEDLAISISPEKEQELGDLLANEILKSYKEIKSDTIDHAIANVRDRLLMGIGPSAYDYRFHVVKEDQVNAFAILGGHIFIFSGMINATENPEELAAVLAHEMGHVEHRDVVYKLAKEMGVTILFSILSGSDPVLAGEIARTAISSAFDRSQEAKADDFAMQTLMKAGISPRYVSIIFRRLKEKYGDYDEHLSFLMSHPNLNSRIKKSLEFPIDKDFKEEKFAIDWAAVKRNL